MYILFGIAVVFFLCLYTGSDASDADSEITVSGTVTVPDAEGATTADIDKLVIAFVSDDHVVMSRIVDGKYSVVLKSDTDYNIRCYNKGVPLGGSEMSYVLYSDYHTAGSDTTLDVALEKAVDFTDDSGNKYYLYASGFATLVKLNVEYETLDGNVGYCLKAGSSFIIPEYIRSNDVSYKVTFVGDTVSSATDAIGVICGPEQKHYGVFNGATSNLLTIRFMGDVILNYQPFTKPWANGISGTLSSPFNISICFDKDVTVNSYPNYTERTGKYALASAKDSLYSVKEISIGGTYHGAIIVATSTQVYNEYAVYSLTYNDLANCTIKSITFDKNMDISKDTVLKNSTILSMGLFDDSTLTVEPAGNGYCIKNKAGTTVCSSVSNVVFDPITLSVVNGDSVTYSLLTKGSVLEDPVAPEGMEFGGWYKDSAFTQVYDSNEALNANTTVYAKYVPKQYTISIIGDDIVVKNGDNAVANGSKIEFDTDLTLVIDNRIGYNAIVKMDGVIVTEGTIRVPAKDFAISCEWVAIPYTVKCMDGETVVKTFENCRLGDVISLPAIDKAGFTGWSVGNGMLLGAQYIVNYRDAENDTIVLIASFTELQDAVWELTVTGGDGKAFWTKSNAIGSYGIVTVLPAEFEKASVSIDPAVDGAYVGKLSDNTYMVYSANGGDVTVAVAFQSVEKSSEYTVSLVEIAKEGSPGFRATVAATDGGIVDTSGKLSIRYVYKAMDEASGLWCFTTSGQTTGVDDYVVPLGGANDKAYSVTGDFYLNSIEAADGAYLVYGYASYAFGDSSVTAETTVVTSPVIMSVSEIQAVVSKS